jgi:hypothetical protein
MNIKRHVLSAIILSSMLALCGNTLAANEPTLESLKQTYDKGVQKIEADHASRLLRLQDGYSVELDKALATLKQQGDPEPVRQGLGEVMRFQQEKTVPYPPATNLPPVVQDVQKRYNAAARNAEVEKGRTFLDFAKQYIASLDSLMRAYTAQEKLDLASGVKKEKDATEAFAASVAEQVKKMGGALPTSVAVPLSGNPSIRFITSLDQIVAAIPPDVMPHNGQWTEIKANAANQQLAAKIDGCKVRLRLKVDIPHWASGHLIYAQVDVPQGFPVRVFAKLSEENKDKLASINKGDVVVFDGVMIESRVIFLWKRWCLSVRVGNGNVTKAR